MGSILAPVSLENLSGELGKVLDVLSLASLVAIEAKLSRLGFVKCSVRLWVDPARATSEVPGLSDGLVDRREEVRAVDDDVPSLLAPPKWKYERL